MLQFTYIIGFILSVQLFGFVLLVVFSFNLTILTRFFKNWDRTLWKGFAIEINAINNWNILS